MHLLILSAGKVLKKPFGGEDLFSRRLGKWLVALNQEVTLMGIDYAGIRVKHMTYAIPKDELIPEVRKKENKPGKYSYLLYSLRTMFWISQVFRIILINIMNPISIIHSQDSGYTGLAAIIAGKILHLPVILTLHGIRYEQIESNPYVNEVLKTVALKIESRLDAYTLRNATIVTIVSDTMRSYVESVAPQSNIASVPVAIKNKKFEFSESKRQLVRNELGIKDEFKIIGFVGRLAYEKNLATLLYSFADVLKEDPSLILVLVGEGPLENELKKLIRKLDIGDKVIFCGFRGDISNILSSFDIFVLPSFIEGTSNALLEAMSCGCAIICSDIPGNRELVANNDDVLLINPTDRKGFKDAIVQLLTDSNLRNRLKAKVKMKARQYDEEIIFPKYLRYYQELCSGT